MLLSLEGFRKHKAVVLKRQWMSFALLSILNRFGSICCWSVFDNNACYLDIWISIDKIINRMVCVNWKLYFSKSLSTNSIFRLVWQSIRLTCTPPRPASKRKGLQKCSTEFILSMLCSIITVFIWHLLCLRNDKHGPKIMIKYFPIPREKNITTTNYNCEHSLFMCEERGRGV